MKRHKCYFVAETRAEIHLSNRNKHPTGLQTGEGRGEDEDDGGGEEGRGFNQRAVVL